MPDGLICQYDPSSGRLTRCDDPFGNSVLLTWTTGQLTVTQLLVSGGDVLDTRDIVQAIASESGLTYVAGSMTTRDAPGAIRTHRASRRPSRRSTPHGGTSISLRMPRCPCGSRW